jgi:putative ABC transport system permease protein
VAVENQRLVTEDVARIRSIRHRRNLSAVAPKLIGAIDGAGGRMIVVGADLRQERIVKPWWQIEGNWPASTEDVLIGSELARRDGRTAGDLLELGHRVVRVAGVIGPTGSLDDHAIIASLDVVQQVLGRPGELSAIEVSALCRGCPIEDIVAQTGAALPHARVLPIRQAVAARERALEQMTHFAWIVSIVVLAAAALVVSTTMLASVAERTREIGILRAVGFRQVHVMRIVLLEVAVTSLVGGALGWGLGTVAAFGLARSVADLDASVLPDGTMAAAALGLALLLGVGAGVYPALRAARMDPTQAFREF